MTDNLFTKSINTERHERLVGEILAFVSDADSHGYTNMEIVRALWQASNTRARREDSIIYESFVEWEIETATRFLAKSRAFIRECALRMEKEKQN